VTKPFDFAELERVIRQVAADARGGALWLRREQQFESRDPSSPPGPVGARVRCTGWAEAPSAARHAGLHRQIIHARLERSAHRNRHRKRGEAASLARAPIGQDEGDAAQSQGPLRRRPPHAPLDDPRRASGISNVRKRLGPGSTLVAPNSGTSNGESIESESTVTSTGSKRQQNPTRGTSRSNLRTRCSCPRRRARPARSPPQDPAAVAVLIEEDTPREPRALERGTGA